MEIRIRIGVSVVNSKNSSNLIGLHDHLVREAAAFISHRDEEMITAVEEMSFRNNQSITGSSTIKPAGDA